MRTPTKFVEELTDEQKSRLQAIMKSNAPQRTRMRAHVVLLSARRFSVDQIAAVYEVDRDRVSQWLEWWRESEVEGLADDARAGRPPKLSSEEQAQVLEIVRQEPRSVRRAVSEIDRRLKKVSRRTVKRLLRARRQKWKRARRGLTKQRDETQFRRAQSDLNILREQWRDGHCEFEVWYFDEAGFSLTGCVPSAWQVVGERIELESRGNQGKRQNVLGFLRWDGADFYGAAFEGSIDNHLVAGCFRAFAAERRGGKPKLIILDNAPAHRGEEFEEALEELETRGIFVMFLPSYSPELNLIELLWRKIKYEWLPLDIYGSYQTMCEGLFEVLKEIGSKYRITFG